MVPKICRFTDCDRPVRGYGLCATHRLQERSGKPLREIGKRPTLVERFNLYADKTGECWQWTGAMTPAGYPRLGTRGYGHRVAWEIANGQDIPPKMQIDHICHNPGCVNPDHLRLATRKQNIEHHSGPKKNCKSGVRGVMLHKETGKWRPRVLHNGVVYNLGLYHDLAEAEAVVVAKRNELHSRNDADRQTSN